jgi:hypothetical protein
MGSALAGPLVRGWMAGADVFAAMNAGLADETRALLGPGAAVTVVEDPLLVPLAEAPVAADPDRFVMIGRLEPQKDTALGLRAMAALRATRRARGWRWWAKAPSGRRWSGWQRSSMCRCAGTGAPLTCAACSTARRRCW